jgi:hypothetical protein
MLSPVRTTAEPLVTTALEVSDPDGYRLYLYQPPR